jgi:glycosyltransferase involved in cell wall biosynthesis
MTAFRCCAIVPTYDNPMTIRPTIEQIRRFLPDVLVIDDGSAAPGREACLALEREGLIRRIRLERNCGKGAAVKAGLEAARRAGFSHAFQIDADGQHDLDRVPAFLEIARRSPESVILGFPEYDDSVPRLRLAAREITRFWVDLEVGGEGIVRDAMVGFRIYPIGEICALRIPSNRMDFDIEVAVRLCWAGAPIVNLPVGIRYPSPEEGGLSHFRPFLDNLRLSWLHARLCTEKGTRRSLGWLRRRAVLERS